ncbi:alcohol dehydrogenase catalytic domain-containing protein, partial [Streptomyces malaysiensis]
MSGATTRGPAFGLGSDVVGVVDQVGEGVTAFSIGDEVLELPSPPPMRTSSPFLITGHPFSWTRGPSASASRIRGQG